MGTPLPADLHLAEWEHYGRCLRTYHAHLTWKVVDWLLHAERRWGETYHQFAEASGFSRGALMNYASVGARTIEARRPELSFSHHQAVASLPTQAQRALLDAAYQQDWTRDETREQVRQWKAATAPTGAATLAINPVEPSVARASLPESAPAVSPPQSQPAPDPTPSRLIAICHGFGMPPIPEPDTAEELVAYLCQTITDERRRADQAATAAANTPDLTEIVAELTGANQRLRARVTVLEAELAKPAPAPPAPEPNACIISDLDMPYLRAIHQAVQEETGSNWTFGGAIGKALQDHAEYLGLKVRK